MALTPEQRRQRARRTNLMMAYAYAAASTKGWTPAQLATGASTWAWYDPSDMGTLFQDSAGTTPVTAAGQAVGRINDKSGNGFNATQSTAAARPIYRIDANGRPYLEFDGTDDSLATGNIDPGSVDKAQVFLGLRKLTAVGTSTMLMETSVSSGANNGTIAVQAPETVAQYRFRSRGTAISDAQTASAGFAAPITNVLCGLGDISGDTATLRINGADIQTSLTDQGTGNFTSQPLYIGARAGTSLFFNGWLYGLIVRFSAANLDAATIANAETWMNGKTGAF